MAEGIACSFYPPHKQVQLDVHECYRFQLKNNMEMRLPLFIYPLFVQEEIMTHDYLFKIYKENVCFLSVMRYNQNVGLKWFQCLSEIVVFIWKFCKYFDHYRGIMLDRTIVTWHFHIVSCLIHTVYLSFCFLNWDVNSSHYNYLAVFWQPTKKENVIGDTSIQFWFLPILILILQLRIAAGLIRQQCSPFTKFKIFKPHCLKFIVGTFFIGWHEARDAV